MQPGKIAYAANNQNGQPVVHTDRLIILPLTYAQLSVYLQAGNLLEQELGLTLTNRDMSPAVKELVEQTTLPAMQAALAQDFVFLTFWLVIEKTSRMIV